MKKIVFLWLALFLKQMLFAQEDAWVYFTDKPNVASAIANPITILTQRAIDRKQRHGIAVDDRDVPVNENYITQIKNSNGITVFAKSKWFNAIHVRGTENNIKALLSISFVDKIVFADDNLNAKPIHYNQLQNKFEEEKPAIVYNYGDAANQIEMINGDNLHLANYTGNGMIVAVLDSGFPNVNTMSAFQYLRSQGNLLDGYDFVDRTSNIYAFSGSSHGTMVLSTMAGFVSDQYVGTAPNASYYLFRTEDINSENPVEESYWVEAAERADSLGVDVINTSLGYKDYDNPNYSYTSADLDGNTTYITKGANIAYEKGLLLVNSAGNSGANGINAPADASGVFSIGAVKPDGSYAAFSSQGSPFQPTQKPDVVAQGQDSFVIQPSDVISTANGTSFSSPILAGSVTCLMEAFPNKTNTEIMQAVRASASQYTTPDYFLGHGIPDFQMAYNSLKMDNAIVNPIILYPNPASNFIRIKFADAEHKKRISIYNQLGKNISSQSISSEENINILNLDSGVYFIRIQDRESTKTLKFIKF